MVDLITLDLHHMEVANSHLISAFEQIQSESNRQAILHYSVVHSLDHELLEEVSIVELIEDGTCRSEWDSLMKPHV